MKHQIDKLDRKILKNISKNARTPFLEIARECDVSGAAIHQRLNKLNNLGILKGSEFILDTYKIGYQTCAYIGVHISDMKAFNEVCEGLKNIAEVVEAHHTTGKYAMLIKVYAKDNRHLLSIIVDKISTIPYVDHTETLFISLDELFSRQISAFEDEEDEEETVRIKISR